MTHAERVREFHRTFGLPVRDRPDLGTDDERTLRFNLIHEELEELFDAFGNRDAVKVLDALADIVYVAYGAAVQFGLPLDDAIYEVHRSNMTKGHGGWRRDGKVLKGPDYSPPDLASVLDRFLVVD